MKDVRINLTEDEKVARELLGTDSNFQTVNMKEKSIDSLIAKERANKFNNELDKYEEKLEENNKNFNESVNNISYDIEKAEIKPMFSRVIVKPFKQNPFQKMEVKSGIIVDTGGYTPHTQLNPKTGKYEEQQEFIITGCVIEVGPEVKYLQEGDVIYFRKDTSVPVPFFKQGLVSLDEKQIIAVVNESLEERFNKINS